MSDLNIKELLIKYSKENPSESRTIISKVILTEINENKKPSLSEIAKKANISKSSIVKFCNKIGFDGYIEFRTALLAEQKFNYNIKEFVKKDALNLTEEFHKKIWKEINFIERYINEFDWFANNIKKYKTIYILGSEENSSLCSILNDYLSSLNLNVKYSHFRAQWIYPNFFNEKTLLIFLVSGMSNEKLEDYYNIGLENKSEMFLISTESQTTKFKEIKHKIVLRYLDFFPWYQSRVLIFLYVINLLFYFINHYYSDYYSTMYNPKIKY